MSKLLKILFVVLLVVTVAEAGYYVYVLKIKNTTSESKQMQELTQSSISPSPLPVVTQSNAPPVERLLSTDTITFLQNMKKAKDKTVLITIEEHGYLDEILSQSEGKVASLKIVDANGVNVISIVRDIEFWNKVLFKQTENGEVQYGISDLKKGDPIQHTLLMDMTNNTETHKFIVITR